MNPSVSVIIPAYNAERYLNDALQSVYNQTYDKWECIIVYDGSKDSTEGIARQWTEKDQRFRYYYKPNAGVSAARNLGIQKSQGEYVAFLDADDIFMPDKIERQLDIIAEKNVSAVFSNYKNFNSDVTAFNFSSKKFHTNQGIGALLSQNIINTCTVLAKKNIITEVGCFDFPKNAEDFHLWLKILLSGGKMCYDCRPTVYHRVVENSLSSNDRNCTKEVIEVLINLEEKLKKRDINYSEALNLWIRRFILLRDNNNNIIPGIKDRMIYVNNLVSNYFPKYLIILPVSDRLKKILAVRIINQKNNIE